MYSSIKYFYCCNSQIFCTFLFMISIVSSTKKLLNLPFSSKLSFYFYYLNNDKKSIFNEFLSFLFLLSQLYLNLKFTRQDIIFSIYINQFCTVNLKICQFTLYCITAPVPSLIFLITIYFFCSSI
jgi:hypothetical protein